MPMYEFRCQKCGRQFEELVGRFGEKAPCPSCGSKDVERLVSAPTTPLGDRLRKLLGGSSACGPSSGRFG